MAFLMPKPASSNFPVFRGLARNRHINSVTKGLSRIAFWYMGMASSDLPKEIKTIGIIVKGRRMAGPRATARSPQQSP